VLAALDLSSIEAVPGDHVDARLRERLSDALFRAKFNGEVGYIYLLLEHQSEVDRWMPLRLLEQAVRIWRAALRDEPATTRLPPIVCVVVHHGESGWTGPRTLHELIDGLPKTEGLGELVPNFQFVLDDLAGQTDEALAARPLAPFPKLVLWALRDARARQRLREHLPAWGPTLEQLARESQEDTLTLLRYVFLAAGGETFEELQREVTQMAPSTDNTMLTIGEQLMERGRVKGHADGKAEGKAEGVLAVLAARGLAVSEEQRARVLACADLAILDGWLRTAATCSETAALFSH
jgi:predicted transposase YdaD